MTSDFSPMHQLVPLQHTAIALHSLRRMIHVQMKIIPAADHVRRDSGRERPSMLPASCSPRRYALLDVAALGGVLLVKGSHTAPQRASQTPGNLWLSMWHFILPLSQRMWGVLQDLDSLESQETWPQKHPLTNVVLVHLEQLRTKSDRICMCGAEFPYLCLHKACVALLVLFFSWVRSCQTSLFY